METLNAINVRIIIMRHYECVCGDTLISAAFGVVSVAAGAA